MNKSLLKDVRWIKKNFPELSKNYGGNYIAVSNKKVIACNPDYSVVHDTAQRTAKDYMITYVETGDQIITPFLCSDFE